MSNQQNCQSCNTPIIDLYCPHCGEKRFSQADLSYKKLLKQLAESLTDIDGKVIGSFKALIFSPGTLSNNYLNGIRRNWLNPFQVFILANILYFFALSFMWQVTYNTPLEIHLTASNFFHKDTAITMVNQELIDSNRSMEEFRLVFDQSIALLSKSLVILNIPIFTLLSFLIFINHQHALIKTAFFSTHFYAFLLLFQVFFSFLVQGLSKLSELLLNYNLQSIIRHESTSTTLLFLAVGVYFYFSSKKVFSERWWVCLIKTIAMVFAMYIALIIYRAILFFIAFYTVS